LILLDLRSVLKIALRSDIKDQSLTRLKNQNRSFEVSMAAFLLGSVATLAVTAAIMASFVFAKKIPLMSTIVIWTSLFSVTYWGYSTLKKLGKDTFDPLHSNGLSILETLDMEERWVSFNNWAKEKSVPLYIKDKKGGCYIILPNIWQLDHCEVFVLGEDAHRYELLKDARQLTSHLYIQKSDWDAFLQLFEERNKDVPNQGIPIQETFLKVSKGESAEKPLKDEEPSLRQRLFKPGTKKALRFRMMVMHPELASRYYSAGINQSNLTEADKACHSAMMLILKDPILFHDVTKNDGELQTLVESEFLLKLNIALNITSKNHTRRNEILNYAWDKLELYLEGLNIISEDEVTKFYKGFEENLPQGTDSKTIWKKIIS